MHSYKIKEIDDHMRVLNLLKKLYIFLVILIGINSALAITHGNYTTLPLDVLVVLLLALNVSDNETQMDQLQAEKEALLSEHKEENNTKES